MRQIPYGGPKNFITTIQNFVAMVTRRMVFVHFGLKSKQITVFETAGVRTDEIPSEIITSHMKRRLCNSAHTFLIDSRNLIGLGTPRRLMGEWRYDSILAWFQAFAAI